MVRVAVTQAEGTDQRLLSILAARGFDPLPLPQIRFERATDPPELLFPESRYDLCILSSPRSAEFMPEPDKYVEALTFGKRTYSVALSRGFRARLIESDSLSELVEKMPPAPPTLTIAFPRSDIAPAGPVQALRERGHRVSDAVLYRTVPVEYSPEEIRRVRTDPPEVFVFTSPSTFHNLVTAFGRKLLDDAVIAAIGPTTTAAIRESGLPVHVTPDRPGLDALVASLKDYHEKHHIS